MAKTSKLITNDLLQRFWDGFKNKLHIHSNQSILDGTTASYTTAEKTKLGGLSTIATSGSYNDLSNKPTIPTVNNATLTIQKNGTSVGTFSANASSNATANITVPTKLSELTNDSGYKTTDTTYGVVSTTANGLAPKRTGTTTKYLRDDGTWAIPPDTNTTYSAATTSTNGLMTSDMVTKLNGIASGANAYSLPTATSSVLGGVKSGSNITNTSGVLSLTKANVTSALGYTPPTSDTNTWRGIQDNLTSTSATDSLSANQGKVLKGLVDGKAASTHTHSYAGSSSAGGSATSAVKLQTSRKINGISFDGTGDITVPAIATIGTEPTTKLSNMVWIS